METPLKPNMSWTAADEDYLRADRERELRNVLGAGCGPTVPARMHEELVAYVVRRQRPERFLSAVISNDLREATVVAQPDNLKALTEWVRLFHNYVPGVAQGSRERLEAWLVPVYEPEEKTT